MSYRYERQAAAEFAAAAIDKGFRVFLAARGNYGFITDAEGSRVLSFQFSPGGSVSGNYTTDQPQQCGTGWRIADDADAALIAEYWSQSNRAPRWAVGDAKYRIITMAEHLARYQWSSEYQEVFNADNCPVVAP